MSDETEIKACWGCGADDVQLYRDGLEYPQTPLRWVCDSCADARLSKRAGIGA